MAATFSPRFHQVLAEANRVREHFGARLSMIFVGKHDATAERKFAEAIATLKLPEDTLVHYEQGDPANAILVAAKKLGVELLVAGALEKAAVHRQFLGNVARRLVREASCSVMLFTHPELEPKALRHLVFLAEFSEHAQRALRRTVHLAEKEKSERLYVVRSYTSFDKARAARRGKTDKGQTRIWRRKNSPCRNLFFPPVKRRCQSRRARFAAARGLALPISFSQSRRTCS